MPHSTAPAIAGVSASNKTVNHTQVPLVPLETISYKLIRSEDAVEKERLVKACQYPGFYYLDFRGDEVGEEILRDLQEAYAVEEKYFAEHEDPNRMKDIEIKYDSLASTNHNDSNNNNSHSEKIPTSTLPSPLQPHLPLLTRLSHSLREANLSLVSSVTASLPHLTARHHAATARSKTALDLIYAPTKPLAKDAPDTTHTDEGTMTILFNGDWGLKVEDPQSKEWAWVEPRDGCGLVNVGDWLGRVTKEEKGQQQGLHSCRHAVSQVGDGVIKRHYVVHYLRPALEA